MFRKVMVGKTSTFGKGVTIMEPILSILHLNIEFKTKGGIVRAACDVNLDIHQDEIWGLIGETGCGKSVLGLSMLRLLPSNAQTEGNIYYKEKNLLTISKKEIRKIRGKQIAYICQNPAEALNPVLKNGTQIIESIRHNQKTGSTESRKIAEQLLMDLQFDSPKTCMESYPLQLSGGMKQRVLAAMGMSGNPSFLIADEPTKGLDALIRRQVVQTLQKFIDTTKCSALIITHDLKFASALCTHIAVMYAGELVETGSAKDVLSSPAHPYTRALIDSQPHKGLKILKGSAANLIHLPEYCRFYERCEQAEEYCQKVHPPMRSIGDTREARCVCYA